MAQRPIRNLSELMDGGVEERFNEELSKVWNNVFDPNTDATKVREIILRVKINPNERRDVCNFRVSVSSKLAPSTDLSQTVMLQLSEGGRIVATERTDQIPGQIDMDGKETELPRVVSFERSQK